MVYWAWFFFERHSNNCWDLTEEALDAKSFFVEDKCIAVAFNYQDKIKSKEANETVQKVKKASKVAFVEWMPIGLKIGLNNAKVESDPMKEAENTCVMIGSNLKTSSSSCLTKAEFYTSYTKPLRKCFKKLKNWSF